MTRILQTAENNQTWVANCKLPVALHMGVIASISTEEMKRYEVRNWKGGNIVLVIKRNLDVGVWGNWQLSLKEGSIT